MAAYAKPFIYFSFSCHPSPNLQIVFCPPFSFLIAVSWSASATAGMFVGEPLQNPLFPEMIFDYFLLPQEERGQGLVLSSTGLVQGAICIRLWQKIKLHANIPKETPYQKPWQWSLYKTESWQRADCQFRVWC